MKTWLIACTALFLMATQTSATELRVLHAYAKDSYPLAFAEFTRKTGIKIHHEFRPQDRLKTETFAMIDAGTLPDAMILPADHLGLYDIARYSVITPNSFSVPLTNAVWETTLSNGKHYGVPLSQGNHLMLYYNKSLVSTPAATWDELEAQAITLTKQSIASIAWSQEEPYWFLPFLSAFDGWIFAGNTVTLNTPEMAQALDFYEKIRALPGIVKDASYERALEKFKVGKIAYTINGDWVFNELRETLGPSFGVAAIPSIGTHKPIPTFTTRAIAFPNDGLNGPKRAALIKLTQYLQSNEAQLLLWETHNAIPINQTTLNYVKRTTSLPQKSIIDLMANTRALPAQQGMTYVWDALTKGMRLHHDGDVDAEMSAAHMQLLVERHLRNANRLTKPSKPPTANQ